MNVQGVTLNMPTDHMPTDPVTSRVGGITERAGRALAEYGLPFLVVLYLGLQGGGYDLVVRSEVGILIWWLVLLGAAVGVLPQAKLHPVAWVGLGLLFLFVAWTTVAVTWTESTEQTMAEAGRLAVYVGVFVVALSAQRPGAIGRSAGAVGAAIVVISGLALLSRLYPDPFPVDLTADFLEGAQGRLNYPLDYWNGLATFAAMGVPLMLAATAYARRVVLQALAAAAVPLLALTAFYTLSRGGAGEIAVAVVALIVLIPRRLQMLPTLITAGAGSVLLVLAATQRDALEDGLLSDLAQSQGHEMLVATLVVCAGVGLVQAGIGAAREYGFWPAWTPSRALSLTVVGAAALAALIVAIALGAPGTASDQWSEFKSNEGTAEGTERFSSAGGEGRYQLWESAVDANATAPLTGIGPGTFEFWWARNGRADLASGPFVRDAHSLYLETLGELGIVGLVVLLGFIATVLGTGAVLAFRGDPGIRAAVAGATAAAIAFCVAAAVDWVWELSVLPVIFFILAAAILQSARTSERTATGEKPVAGLRIGLVVLSLLALPLLAIPMASTEKVEASRDAFNSDQLPTALDNARAAEDLQPYAATPHLQQALVLEAAGDLDAAAIAARQATDDEPTNWRTWLVRSRVEARRGNAAAATRAYERARDLNPASSLFAQ